MIFIQFFCPYLRKFMINIHNLPPQKLIRWPTFAML